MTTYVINSILLHEYDMIRGATALHEYEYEYTILFYVLLYEYYFLLSLCIWLGFVGLLLVRHVVF